VVERGKSTCDFTQTFFYIPFITAELPKLQVLFPETKIPDHQKRQLFLEVFLWDPSNVKNTLKPLLYLVIATALN